MSPGDGNDGFTCSCGAPATLFYIETSFFFKIVHATCDTHYMNPLDRNLRKVTRDQLVAHLIHES